MRKDVKRVGQAGMVALGAYLLLGGPMQAAGNLFVNNSGGQEIIAQTVGDQAAIEVDTCATVEDWQRPSADEQAKQLEKDARFSTALAGDASKATSDPFWDQSVVSFTTYGLSARLEPVNLTGLWTVEAEMQNCYTPESTMAINAGDRAEAWLLNHQIQSLQKVGDRYVMTVTPTATGMQVVQFDRTDELASLPLDVVNASGEAVAVASGDWQEDNQ